MGQCGNQIALKFWELALKEHAEYNKSLIYDEALSSFFRNVDSRGGVQKTLPCGTNITDLKARSIVVDMESGVINNKILNGELKDIFEARQCVSDQSGAGNNWARGHLECGPKYRDEINEKVRQAVEHCDSLQGFFFTHSLGGGTGSGLGSYILKELADEYPTVFRFSTCVFPSEDDDVVTSPYNSMLALNVLIESADCVLPVDNQALFDIVGKIDQQYQHKREEKSSAPMIKQGSAITDPMALTEKKGGVGAKPVRHYERENSIVAHVINNLTCSMRFEGDLNVDLNEITMNLVPYPRMHFLLSSLSPLYSMLQPGSSALAPRGIDDSFREAMERSNQLIQQANPLEAVYLACGLIVRGPKVEISDITRNVEKLQRRLKMVGWNKEGFKVGHCYQAPLN